MLSQYQNKSVVFFPNFSICYWILVMLALMSATFRSQIVCHPICHKLWMIFRFTKLQLYIFWWKLRLKNQIRKTGRNEWADDTYLHMTRIRLVDVIVCWTSRTTDSVVWKVFGVSRSSGQPLKWKDVSPRVSPDPLSVIKQFFKREREREGVT